jgi:hypothetical protein
MAVSRWEKTVSRLGVISKERRAWVSIQVAKPTKTYVCRLLDIRKIQRSTDGHRRRYIQNIRVVQRLSCIEATALDKENALLLRRWSECGQPFGIINFGQDSARLPLSLPQGRWTKILNSRDRRWFGPGSSLPEYLPYTPECSITMDPLSFALYRSDDRGTT